ncbi:YdcH family protein [Blastomonas sp.]|uniref:YdcH family protein n=1 Tax=Blastomonas sp. TaxID=1909299 RepID=UPI00359449EC
MQQSHVRALEQKHAGIERMIHDEERRPAPDTALLSTLKKQKLRIKEALQLH